MVSFVFVFVSFVYGFLDRVTFIGYQCGSVRVHILKEDCCLLCVVVPIAKDFCLLCVSVHIVATHLIIVVVPYNKARV